MRDAALPRQLRRLECPLAIAQLACDLSVTLRVARL
jgi:hypothetical protein